MALTSWNDIINKPAAIEEAAELELQVQQLSASVTEIALDVSQLSASVLSISEDVGEIALDVSQLSASVLSIAGDVEAIEPKSVLSIPANTYASYALALAAIKTAFDTLSTEDQARAAIVRNERLIARNFYLIRGKFYAFDVVSDAYGITAYDLQENTLIGAVTNTTGTVFSNYSSTVQDQKLELILI